MSDPKNDAETGELSFEELEKVAGGMDIGRGTTVGPGTTTTTTVGAPGTAQPSTGGDTTTTTDTRTKKPRDPIAF